MIDNLNKPLTDMTYEETTNQLFAWIVEDPFYSTIHNSWVRVNDFSSMFVGDSEDDVNYRHMDHLTDGMIRVLYKEWYNHQDPMIEQSSAPNPNEV